MLVFRGCNGGGGKRGEIGRQREFFFSLSSAAIATAGVWNDDDFGCRSDRPCSMVYFLFPLDAYYSF